MRHALALLILISPLALADPVAVSPDGDANAQYVAVSGTGDSRGWIAASGSGDAASDRECISVTCSPGASVSGTGHATSNNTHEDEDPQIAHLTWISASGTGRADYAIVGVSGTGDADASYAAIAPMGNASGSYVAVTVFGTARRGFVSVDVAGHCTEQVCADVATEGDADAVYLAVAPHGNASGLVAIASGDARSRYLGVSTRGETTGLFPARAEVDADEPRVRFVRPYTYPFPPCDIEVAADTADAWCAYLGASAFGDANGIVAISPTGNASGTFALAPLGHAHGATALGRTASGGTPVAQGDASGSSTAVSVAGDASATILAASLLGNAESLTAVSVLGDAQGNRAVSVFGDADGQVFAASVFGEADAPTAVSVCELVGCP